MFTGLIEHAGRIAERTALPDGSARLVVDLGPLAEGAAPGASIAVDGCCLTIVELRGARASFDAVPETLRRTTLGLRAPGDHHGPRLHDFRHALAVRTVLRWYRQGVDVDPRMPALSTYLGHGHVSDTYWYLSSVPELLRLAAARLDGSHRRQLS